MLQTPDKQAELLKLCAKIGNLMVVERNPTIPEQLETGKLLAKDT